MRALATQITPIAAAALLLGAVPAAAGDGISYDVTVTNLARGQSYTPILVATHRPGLESFVPGDPASRELAPLAEGGDTTPLRTAIEHIHDVSTAQTGGLLEPGQSVTVTVGAGGESCVHVHAGIHGIGGLAPGDCDWPTR